MSAKEDLEFIILKVPHGNSETIQKVAYLIQHAIEEVYPNFRILITQDELKPVSKEEIKTWLQEIGLELKENGTSRKT